jgi:hypothetical protein
MTAPLVADHQFRLEPQTLRIMTPLATERATLEEDRRADSGTVMDRITLNVKDQAVEHSLLRLKSGRLDGFHNLLAVHTTAYDRFARFQRHEDRIDSLRRL